MGIAQYLTWRRVRWLLFWALIIFVVSTYLADWWSLKVEKTVIDGQTKYKIKARIHMGQPYVQEAGKSKEVEVPVQNDKFKNEVQIQNIQHELIPPNISAINRPKRPTTVGLVNVKPTLPTVLDSKDKGYAPKNPPQPVSTMTSNHNDKDSLDKKIENSKSYAKVTDIPSINVRGASCEALFKGDKTEVVKASQFQTDHPKKITPDKDIYKQAQNCETFRKDRKYIMSPINQEEADFPIAFSILLFKDVEMVERLLRAIYRPQNFYCIHVDKKSSADVRNAMTSIASCFDNVFMSYQSVDVQWGWYSVLEPEIICMEDLWKKYARKWKYFINLTGQEFPMKTNWELVKILKAYNGANDMESTVKRRNEPRTQFIHNGFYQTNEKKPPCPVNVTISKGSVHIAVQSGYVDFVLHNPSGQKFLEWVKDTGVPDETFFSSLNVSPQLGVPGATTGDVETNKDTNPFFTRFKNWGTWPFDFPCAGKRVRMVCIFGIGDLPLLGKRPEMFANKFYPDYNPLAYDCMEERHFNKTRNEVLGSAHFDDSLYRQLEFVKHHIT